MLNITSDINKKNNKKTEKKQFTIYYRSMLMNIHLYTNVIKKINDLEDIRENVESLIHDNGMNDECVISSNDVSNAIYYV